MKTYQLLGVDGQIYLSEEPGTFGGNSKLKIYGRLDCPSALSTIRRFPGSYEKSRVFLQMKKQHSLPAIALAEIVFEKNIKNTKTIHKNTVQNSDYNYRNTVLKS